MTGKSLPHSSIRLDSESDKYEVVSVVAVKPHGWRDAWAVLRGTYAPLVRRRTVLTMAGMSRAIKDAWTPEKLAVLHSSPLLDRLHKDDK